MFVYVCLLQKNNFARNCFCTQKLVGAVISHFFDTHTHTHTYIYIYIFISILCIETTNVLLFSTGLEGYNYAVRTLYVAYYSN